MDNFDKFDKDELETDKANTSKARTERKEFKVSLREMRKVFREKVKAENGKRIKTPSRDRARFMDPLGRKRYPANVTPGELTTAQVEEMAPPGSSVYHDTWNGRWLMSMGTIVRSRSWLKYGHTQSAIVLLGKMWERYQELYGLANCPVPGLIELGASLDTTARAATQPVPEPAPDEEGDVPEPGQDEQGPDEPTSPYD